MATYNTSEFKAGLKIILDNDPFSIVENEMVKPARVRHQPLRVRT